MTWEENGGKFNSQAMQFSSANCHLHCTGQISVHRLDDGVSDGEFPDCPIPPSVLQRSTTSVFQHFTRRKRVLESWETLHVVTCLRKAGLSCMQVTAVAKTQPNTTASTGSTLAKVNPM